MKEVVWKRLFIVMVSGIVMFFAASRTIAQVIPDLQNLPVDQNLLRNASPDELQRLLKDYNQKKETKQGKDMHRRRLADTSRLQDTTSESSLPEQKLDIDQTYGMQIFRSGTVVEVAELSTPPADYPIGVGDHIIVSLWGGADFEQDYIVARDGSIFPQGLGKITLQGLTFQNARAVLLDRFRRVVPPSTNISVTLGQPRSVVVQASGNVENPGPVVVSAFSNALNVIALAGGVTEFGNLRNILISRNGKVIDSIDVYKYLNTGDYGKHLYLENNDFIIVPFYDKKVLASGQFKRPMYYQLKSNEGVADLIRYAGGFTSRAYRSGTVIIRNENEKQVIKSVNLNESNLAEAGRDASLLNGDMVIIRLINAGIRNKVIVKGEVAYPDVYEVKPGDRLFDVLNRAGGVTPNTFMERAYIYKGAGDSNVLVSDKIDVSLTDFNKNLNSSQNVPIEDNDVIEVFNKKFFMDAEMISIEGEVRNPGTFKKYGGMTLKDLLFFAHGLKPSAEHGSIVVSSIVDVDSLKQGMRPTKTIVRTFSVNSNLVLDSATENVLLKSYDQVFVRKNPNFRLQQNIILEGEVMYPGKYPKLSRDERLSSFIKRAGGLTVNSNGSGAIVYRKKDTVFRENPLIKKNLTQYVRDSSGGLIDSIVFDPSEPISIDLVKALEDPGSKYDLILQGDDVLYIPEVNPVVTVRGAVQSQLKMYFDKQHNNLSYYIDKAGGFGEKPWRSRIYVTYANGKSRRTRNFGFFHFYPKVEEGSIIMVPERPAGKGLNTFAGQVIITSIPVLIAYILTTTTSK